MDGIFQADSRNDVADRTALCGSILAYWLHLSILDHFRAMTTFEKILVATMAAVIVLVAVALLSLPIPPDGPGAYAEELPNPSISSDP